MTYPKGYSPPAGLPGGRYPGCSPNKKGHKGAAAAIVIIIIVVIAGVSIYSASIPQRTSTLTTAPPSSQPSSLASETAQNDCDTSYPDFCIQSPPPDLDCADISQKRLTVSGSDPHGFDRDNDDVGCE